MKIEIVSKMRVFKYRARIACSVPKDGKRIDLEVDDTVDLPFITGDILVKRSKLELVLSTDDIIKVKRVSKINSSMKSYKTTAK